MRLNAQTKLDAIAVVDAAEALDNADATTGQAR